MLRLSFAERRSGFVHGDARIPLSAVRAVRTVDDPWAELRGMRSPGITLRKSLAVGTWRFPGGKDFVALHGRSRGVLDRPERARVRPDPLLVGRCRGGRDLDRRVSTDDPVLERPGCQPGGCGVAAAFRHSGQPEAGCISGTHLPPQCRRGYRGRCDARVPVFPQVHALGTPAAARRAREPRASAGCGPRARRRGPREPARARSGRGCPGRTRARSAARPRRAEGRAPSGRRARRG